MPFGIHLVHYVSGLEGDGFERYIVFASDVVKAVGLRTRNVSAGGSMV